MKCSICDGHGDFVAHLYYSSPKVNGWFPMSPKEIPDHMKNIIEIAGPVCVKKCLCCDGTGESKDK